jgi:hypothetical protein
MKIEIEIHIEKRKAVSKAIRRNWIGSQDYYQKVQFEITFWKKLEELYYFVEWTILALKWENNPTKNPNALDIWELFSNLEMDWKKLNFYFDLYGEWKKDWIKTTWELIAMIENLWLKGLFKNDIEQIKKISFLSGLRIVERLINKKMDNRQEQINKRISKNLLFKNKEWDRAESKYEEEYYWKISKLYFHVSNAIRLIEKEFNWKTK